MRGLLKAGVVLAPALVRAVALKEGESPSLHPLEGDALNNRGKDTIPSALITLHLPDSDDDTTTGDLVMRFDINEATEACGSGNVLISGQSLSEEGSGSLVIENDRLIDAAWNFTCVTWNDVPQEQLLSLNVDFVDGRPVEDVGFTVRFQQIAPIWISDVEGPASMTRLHSINQTKPDCHDADGEMDVDAELAELDYLRWQMHELRQEIFARERRLAEVAGWDHHHRKPMMVEDCDNLRCVARALFHKVKGAAMSFYTGDNFSGPHGSGHHGPGPHGKGPNTKHHGDHKHQKQSPGEFSFRQHEHHGNHTRNGTHPHPPQHGHPPPFCKCAPPPPFPPHGGPHGGPPGGFAHHHHGPEHMPERLGMGHHGMEQDETFSHSREGHHGPDSKHHHDFAPEGHDEKHGHDGAEHHGSESEHHHGSHTEEHTGKQGHHAPGPYGMGSEHHHQDDSAPGEPMMKEEEHEDEVEVVEVQQPETEVVEVEQPEVEVPEILEPAHEEPAEAELRRDFEHPEGPHHEGPFHGHHGPPHDFDDDEDHPHPHNGPPHDGPGSFEDDGHMMPPPPPPFSPDGPPHGAPHGPPHGPPHGHFGFIHIASIAASVILLGVFARVLHQRCSRNATSAAFSHRRRRSYSNAPWYKKLCFGPQYYQKLEDEEKEAMLRDCDSDCSSVEGDGDVVARDITQFRTAADVVNEMVAVEEARLMSRAEGHSRQTSSASMQQVFHHVQPAMPIQMNSVPMPISAEAAAMFPDLHQGYVVDEALPAYQEADRSDDDDVSEIASSLMADGYRPGGSYTPSESGSQGASDILGDTKN